MNPRTDAPARPHFVKRMQRYQFSVTLTESQVDRLERLRIRGGHRSWNAVIVALLASAPDRKAAR